MDQAVARALMLMAIGGIAVLVCVFGGRAYRARRGRFGRGKRGRERAVSNKQPVDQAQQRVVINGKWCAQRAVEVFQGGVQHHKNGRDRAVQMCQQGHVNEAAAMRLLEYQNYARRAVMLAGIVGIDGGTGIALIDNIRANVWLSKRINALSAARSGIRNDPPLSLGKSLLYRITHGPRTGACYELYLFHETSQQHYTKMLEEAQNCLRHGLEREAREMLCRERDRCITYSFQPGERVASM